MDKLTQVIAVGIRIAAIFMILWSIRNITALISWISYSDSLSLVAYLYSAAIIVIPIVVAILIWKFPLAIAGKIVPEVSSGKPIEESDIAQLQAAALSVAGVIILAIRIPDIPYWLTYLDQLTKISPRRDYLNPEVIASIATTAFEILLGVWLMLGAQGITGFIRKLRTAGIKY